MSAIVVRYLRMLVQANPVQHWFMQWRLRMPTRMERVLIAGLSICMLAAFVTEYSWVPRVINPWHDESVNLGPGTRISVYYSNDVQIGTLVVEALKNREFLATSTASLSNADESDLVLRVEVDWREPLSVAWYHPSRKLISMHMFLYEPESMVLVGATSVEIPDTSSTSGYPNRPFDKSDPISAVNEFIFRDLVEICTHSLLYPSTWRSGP